MKGPLISHYDIKIDNAAVDGLLGVKNSLAYKVHEIEQHFHGEEYWLGILAPQVAGTDWAKDTLAPFVAISGNDDYGADANDEAQVLGTADTPRVVGQVRYDIHRIFIVDADHSTPYKLRIVWGTTTLAQAITDGNFSELVLMVDAANPAQSNGVPVAVQMPRLYCGIDKLWVQAWNATNDSQIDFLVGIHEYSG